MTNTSISELRSINVKISPRQEQLIKLYIKAHGRSVVWIRKGKMRILEPMEVLEVIE